MPYTPYENSFDSEESSPNTFMFVSQPQQQHSQQSLYSPTVNDSPQGWPPYDQTLLPPFQSQPLPYRGFPPAAPYPAPRLSSPLNIAGGGHTATSMSRLSLAGSLDPATGIFYRTPEHPRLRTAQACEKCRTRKAKCSGDHPACKRCINRGLVCEYAKEGRVRGPNKVKSSTTGSSSLKNIASSTTSDPEQNGRTSSVNSSVGSAEHSGTSTFTGDTSETLESAVHSNEGSPVSPSPTRPEAHKMHSPSAISFVPMSQQQQQLHSPYSPHTGTLSQEFYAMTNSSTPSESSSRRSSLSAVGVGLTEHRSSRSHPANIGLDTADQWQQDLVTGSHQAGWTNHQPTVGLDVNGLGSELGMDLQDPQRQYERQRLIQSHRYLQEQRRFALQHQHRQMLNSSNGFEYPQAQSLPHHQPLSLSLLPQQQPQGISGGVNVYQPPPHPPFSPSGEYAPPTRGVEYSSGTYPLLSQGYAGQVDGTMRREERSQSSFIGIEETEQDLHPSLSRAGRRVESVSDERSTTDDTAGDYGGNMSRVAGIDESNDRSAWL
ncbi:hypothetical protein AGABI1DRAFT_108042 [Agaricus bisporus var. burnettii JB137-S8]|uniref:Zn(2)-C6 fungal-type domain-containing protein n=1 Tax=Agaricus bisporus var. burnettii (strain JB137-S8 / ATCC MYA-4627 / FGSC 10392) TaxID=597362 RepID=K5X3M0_AGABU|nr:uncharacterized protein AGABI1DRAFT_108042 [Agaricus bisporus var. burnettii JB137-S8]EKM77522.1 hypothetical protein AGABI1DRAFT_108042 [Agaricus bisporus var. burnettii JB137-S8]